MGGEVALGIDVGIAQLLFAYLGQALGIGLAEDMKPVHSIGVECPAIVEDDSFDAIHFGVS